MSDAILNKFVSSGTAAERAAFTPDPPVPPAGPAHGYFWFETDTDSLYAWDESLSPPDWVLIASGGGNVSGPVGSPASTDNAVPRWVGTSGDQLEDTGVTIDDDDILTANGVHIPMFDAGNSGTSKTLDWNDGNEQRLTLTGNVTLTLSNPRDGGRYVLVLNQDGTGGRTVTWPAAVKWPAGSTPTITTGADKFDLVTLIYLSTESIYLASINQNYDD